MHRQPPSPNARISTDTPRLELNPTCARVVAERDMARELEWDNGLPLSPERRTAGPPVAPDSRVTRLYRITFSRPQSRHCTRSLRNACTTLCSRRLMCPGRCQRYTRSVRQGSRSANMLMCARSDPTAHRTQAARNAGHGAASTPDRLHPSIHG